VRKKKIRGHKRRWNEIVKWCLYNIDLNLTDYLLNESDRYYANIRVHPWSELSLINSTIPEPKGITKQKILNGLLNIYEDWKNQLDKLGQPFYLKIWLFEPRFAQSKVVCAIGENVNYYENTYYKPEDSKKLNSDNYGKLKRRLENFTWDYHLDEDHFDNTEVGEPEIYASRQDFENSKKWFAKLLKKPHRLYKIKEPIGDATASFSFKRGDVWLGERK
jgi:hypothetical protein